MYDNTEQNITSNNVFEEILRRGISKGATDIHILTNDHPVYRCNTIMESDPDIFVTFDNFGDFMNQVLTVEKKKELSDHGEVDFTFSYSDKRFRCNIYSQKNGYSFAIRIIPADVPTIEELSLPQSIKKLCDKKSGLIIVCGPTGSGKSTTLAAMINYINSTRKANIITIEDPIEYIHENKESIIHQRQVGTHTQSFPKALRSALRQDPDIILVGEMRDYDTISTAITASETGHLVLSTLHTFGAVNSIDRMIDVFEPAQQKQIRLQLSIVLEAVISQRLLPKADEESMTVAVELMTGTPAIRSLIREGKTEQINLTIENSRGQDMISLESSLNSLYRKGKISRETLQSFMPNETSR